LEKVIKKEKYIETRKDDNEALFVGIRFPYGRLQGRAIEEIVNKIADRAGLGKSVFPHLFRHSFATHKLNSGMPLPVLQKLMGHESPDVTLIYAELSDENVKHEYKKINN
jgi:integrase/recombinase XerD